MNKYAVAARAHWERTAPSRLKTLENPEEFFTNPRSDRAKDFLSKLITH